MTRPPGLMISAPASGTGKTTLMLGLARALRDRGLIVQPFKSGPDYIDPAFHTAATGRPSYNLDSWSMPESLLASLTATQNADIILAEGSMGLYDGVAAPGACGNGASADIARLMGWPVVLVVDVSGQAQTAAAVARGHVGFRAGVNIAGVVLNRVASPRHEALVRTGMLEAGITVFGALPRQSAIEVPERHLGLVQASEHPALERLILQAASLVAQNLDLDVLIAAAASIPLASPPAKPIRPPGQRIALAQDAAFSFTYPHLLQAWCAAGAEVLPFSPLADEGPAETADTCWLPGGYPELHAPALAAATNFRHQLRAFAETRPVHGECGGYMAMGAALIDKDGASHQMAGLLGLVTSYAKRKMHLGYRLATLQAPIPGHAPGTRLRGHEFHYSSIIEQPDAPLAHVVDATASPVPETGSHRSFPGGGHATGTFFHLIAEAT